MFFGYSKLMKTFVLPQNVHIRMKSISGISVCENKSEVWSHFAEKGFVCEKQFPPGVARSFKCSHNRGALHPDHPEHAVHQDVVEHEDHGGRRRVGLLHPAPPRDQRLGFVEKI